MPDCLPAGAALKFQITDWNYYHRKNGDNEDVYTMQLFGRTKDDHDVVLRVIGFAPYFFIKIPIAWNKMRCQKLMSIVKETISKRCKQSDKYDFDVSESLIAFDIVERHDFFNFDAGKRHKFLKMSFKSLTAMKAYANFFFGSVRHHSLSSQPLEFVRYECNIEPHIRFMHHQRLESCGWIQIKADDLQHIPEYSCCDYSYSTRWKCVNPLECQEMAPLKIMSYDIECISCDHQFPMARRITDRIIQIGFTVYRYGSMICESQHLLTLKKCAPIPGVAVECYQREKNLLRAFARKLREIRPDYKCGYNNLAFDENYMADKAALFDKVKARRHKLNPETMSDKFDAEFMQSLGKLNVKHIMATEDAVGINKFEDKILSSSAMGDNIFKFYQVPGIVSIDILKVVQREHKLDGFKLDNVAANFIREESAKIDFNEAQDDVSRVTIFTKSTKALEPHSYIQIMVQKGYSVSPLAPDVKYFVEEIDVQEMGVKPDGKSVTMPTIQIQMQPAQIELLKQAVSGADSTIYWTFAKDDMHHTVINEYYQRGKPDLIAQIGKYCIQDCRLVNLLIAKLEIIINSINMAKVCHVPNSYIFLRGQGVKIFSLVAKTCREKGYLIPCLTKKIQNPNEDDTSYEGATVITPKPGIYVVPIAVLDFNSLYPNSMREKNLSPECCVIQQAFARVAGYVYHDIEIVLKNKKGEILRGIDGEPRKEYHKFAQRIITEQEVESNMEPILKPIRDKLEKQLQHVAKPGSVLTEEMRQALVTEFKNSHKDKPEEIKIFQAKISQQQILSQKYCDILQSEYQKNYQSRVLMEKNKYYNTIPDGTRVEYGIIPMILTNLLNQRKEVMAAAENETDSAKKTILVSRGNAFKITANSVYGQTGAPTSPIYYKAVAACTTATGRERLYLAKSIVESTFPGSEVIYGDTDSIFINFHIRDEQGNDRTDREALLQTIKLAQQAAVAINARVPKPQCIVYEKTYHPFLLVTKKKYIGLKYGFDADKYTVNAMGIVLKRRDNAAIVKIVVGGIIDYILKHRDLQGAIDYADRVLHELIMGKYSMDKFVISKALRANYKRPSSMPHKVLADRIAVRDPGNKPQINDRIPYVFVVRKNSLTSKKRRDVLQGELVEHPDFVSANGLQIDYLYYLEHQIIKPASQILNLVMPERDVERLFSKYVIMETNKRIGRKNLNLWYDKPELELQSSDTQPLKIKGVNGSFAPEDKPKPKAYSLTKWMDQHQLQELELAAATKAAATKAAVAKSQPIWDHTTNKAQTKSVGTTKKSTYRIGKSLVDWSSGKSKS